MRRMAIADLRAHRLRTLLSVIAVALGVALVTGALTVAGTMTRATASLGDAAYGGVDAALTARSAVSAANDNVQESRATLPAATAARVAAAPAVAHAAGEVLSQNVKVTGRDGKVLGSGPYFGVGMRFADPAARGLSAFRLERGAWPAGPAQVALDAGSADHAGLHVGDVVRASAGGPRRAYRISGLVRFGEVRSLGTATTALFDLPAAQALFGTPGRVDTVLAAARPGLGAAALRARLRTALGPAVQVRSATAQDRFDLHGLKQFVGVIRTVLLILGLVAVLVGAFTIANALSMAVAQQQRTLALLRAAGATRRQVRRLVLWQGLAIGVLGSLLGFAAGFGLAAGITSLFRAFGLSLPTTGMTVTAGVVVTAAAIGVLVPVLAALRPARRAARVAPAEALRDAEEQRPGLVGRGIRAVAGAIGAPAARVGGVAGVLARRNAMRRPGRTGATAAAMTIGVALVAAVGIVVGGLRATATDQVSARVGADYVVASETQGWGPATQAALDRVARVRGVRAVAGLPQDRARVVGGGEVTVAALGPRTTRMLRLPGAEAAPAPGTAIVADRYAAAHHLTPGSTLVLRDARGRSVTTRIAGTYERPPIDVLTAGDVLLAPDDYGRAFRTDVSRLGLVDTGGTTGPAQRAALVRALAAFPGAYVQPVDRWAHDQAAWLDQVLAIVVVLLALAVIVSLLGIVNTLALGVVERTREIGLLRAAGMTRRQVRRMVRWESVVVALVGAGLGVAAGLALGGVAIALLHGQGLGFVVPTGLLIGIAVAAVLAGVAAAALPARRAARIDVLHAVTVE